MGGLPEKFGRGVGRRAEIVDEHPLAPLGGGPCHPLSEPEGSAVPAGRPGRRDEHLLRLVPEPDHPLADLQQVHGVLADEAEELG